MGGRSESQMQNKHEFIVTKLAVVLAIVVVVTAIIAEAGIIRGGITRGHITAFASIFVNGREIDIAQAQITIEGAPAAESDLRLGQVVTVSGGFDDELPVGAATVVNIEDNVEGVVESVDAQNGQLTVLGQTTIVNEETIIELLSGGNGLEDIRVGDVVEVSGLSDATGAIVASRIEGKAAGGEFEVNGTVANLTPTTFSLNGLLIDFSNAEIKDFPSGMISAGDFVEAKGTLAGGGELLARRVERQAVNPAAAGDFIDFEGFITSQLSPGEFALGSVPVITSAATLFENGGPGNLAVNGQVQITGFVDATGAIDATRVRIGESRVRVEATVTSVNGNRFEVLGVPFVSTPGTRWRDKSDAELEDFSFTDLSVGDFVEVRSFKNPSPELPITAERVRREDRDDEVRLQGFVTSGGAQSFAVMGVAVEIAGDTEYEALGGQELDADSFFELAVPGSLVSVKGEQSGDTVFAEEIEFE